MTQKALGKSNREGHDAGATLRYVSYGRSRPHMV